MAPTTFLSISSLALLALLAISSATPSDAASLHAGHVVRQGIPVAHHQRNVPSRRASNSKRCKARSSSAAIPSPTEKPKTTTIISTAAAVHTQPSSNGNSDGNSGSSNSQTGSSSNTGSSGSNAGSSGANTGSSGSNTGSSGSNTGSSSSSGSGSSSGNGSRASDADVQAYLTAHNTIRAQHGAVPVTWSSSAASKAQEWADKCTNQHSGGTLGPLGENLAAGTGTYTIAEAVKDWTDEVSEYNPNNPTFSHFTQVVWKATTLIGCAVQTCDGIFAGFGPAQYYVCEYSVQGNVEGEFQTNVQV